MKRINPVTKQPFVRGDTRKDGMVFYKYTNVVKQDGTFREIWVNPGTLDKERRSAKEKAAASYERKSNRLPNGWIRKLKGHTDLDFLRKVFKEMLVKEIPMHKLEALGVFSQLELDLLSPYTSDYEYKS